ncbi:restriction endonuclease subunit S [Fusobacterium nucleatum]|uniref:restriction endonuclease subunit S n=2 Tax=Fusobacteriaceae TaxID=203492 RepID=UPI0012382611|nr:restriction endonuclease subunit S [Fusobacterium nucleatum]
MKYKLIELIKIKNGKDYKSCKLGDIPVYGTGGIISYIDEFLSNDESILLPRKGSLSNIMYVNCPFWTVDTMYWTDVNREIVLPKYLYFYLKLLDLSSRDSGSTLPSMTFDAYYELEVEIPNIKEQKKILDLLNPIEEKIMINNKINDNLFSQINIIYNYWFIQYEFPNSNGKSYKSNNGELYYNNIIKKEIPINWVVETLASNSLSEIIKPGVNIFEEKIYYTTADIVGKNIINGSIVSYKTKEDRANMQPIAYSVWFAKMKKSIKHLFLTPNIKFVIENSILSTGLCGLKCKETAFEYISSYILHPYFESHKDVLSHGATQEAINNNDLNYIYIIVPEQKILEQYHNLTKSIFEKISENMCENKEFIAIRDFLLPLLMNGQATILE